MKNGVYGLKSFKIQNALNNAFPTSWDAAVEIKAVVKDSLTYNDQAATENDVEVEDMDNFYASLPSGLATKGFTVSTYDMGEETYKHLCGYEKQPEGDWFEEKPGFELQNQAVQIITKAIGDIPSKTFEWANMKVKVTRTGTIGKSGFPNFQIEFKQQALLDAQGKEIAGARWKPTV